MPGGAAAAGLGALDVAPSLRAAPSPHPPAPTGAAPTHRRRGDTDCAGKAALLRRAATEAAGGRAGGGRRDCEGDAPQRLPGPSPGVGVPASPFPLQPWGLGRRWTSPRPLPCPEREGDPFTSPPPPPARGSTRRGSRTEVPSLEHLDSGSPTEWPEVSAQTPLSYAQAPHCPTPSLPVPPSLPGAEPHVESGS